MSIADGSIVGTTKIVDHGFPAERWNVVILGDGYRSAELNKYHTDVETFVNYLYGTVPFNELWSAINVYRVDVASTDSAADDPVPCADGTAPNTPGGTAAATYFDSTFCVGGSTRRLLAGNEATALAVSLAAVPQVRLTMVIVNTPQYGGAGGAVAWFSTDPQSAEIGIHELGHTYFNLDDEYGDILNNYVGGEPASPNVTMDTNLATTKWRTLILPTTPLPTMANPNCAMENNLPSPVQVGTIGLFEGGSRFHCGLYHAEYSCRMRDLGQPFCKVCQQQIRTRLAPFGGTMAWELTGNSGTNPAATFLGTKDNQPLTIKTNGVERLVVDSAGHINIKQSVTVGAGGSAVLHIRHIDGKDWQSDNPDGLFLNHSTKQPVWIGNPTERSGLFVSGDAVIGAGANSGILRVRHIDGKDWQSDNPDGLFLNHSTKQPVWIGNPTERSGLFVSGDAVIGAGGNSGILRVRHIDGKDWQSDNPDGLFLNHSTKQPVWIGNPTERSGLFVSGDAVIGAGGE